MKTSFDSIDKIPETDSIYQLIREKVLGPHRKLLAELGLTPQTIQFQLYWTSLVNWICFQDDKGINYRIHHQDQSLKLYCSYSDFQMLLNVVSELNVLDDFFTDTLFDTVRLIKVMYPEKFFEYLSKYDNKICTEDNIEYILYFFDNYKIQLDNGYVYYVNKGNREYDPEIVKSFIEELKKENHKITIVPVIKPEKDYHSVGHYHWMKKKQELTKNSKRNTDTQLVEKPKVDVIDNLHSSTAVTANPSNTKCNVKIVDIHPIDNRAKSQVEPPTITIVEEIENKSLIQTTQRQEVVPNNLQDPKNNQIATSPNCTSIDKKLPPFIKFIITLAIVSALVIILAKFVVPPLVTLAI